MAFSDSFVERFDTGAGFTIGYANDGRVAHDIDGPATENVVLTMLWVIQNPEGIARAVDQARTGRLAAPYEALGEVGELVVDHDGVRAEIDLPDDSYEQRMSFAEFAPILTAWVAAWEGARAQRDRGAGL